MKSLKKVFLGRLACLIFMLPAPSLAASSRSQEKEKAEIHSQHLRPHAMPLELTKYFPDVWLGNKHKKKGKVILQGLSVMPRGGCARRAEFSETRRKTKKKCEFSLHFLDSLKVLPEEPLLLVKKDITPISSLPSVARLNQWRKAWEASDYKTFMEFYAEPSQVTMVPGGKKWWLQKKRLLESNKGFIKVDFSDPLILNDDEVLHVFFIQKYKGKHRSDVGIKYLTLDKKSHKILSEKWSPSKETTVWENAIASFKPEKTQKKEKQQAHLSRKKRSQGDVALQPRSEPKNESSTDFSYSSKDTYRLPKHILSVQKVSSPMP